jgi:hypothetical protein
VPSIYDCINQKADAIKAQRWLDYKPLPRYKFKDQDDNLATVTLDVGVFGQFVVLKRPTEGAAIRGDSTRNLIVRRRRTVDWRWCIHHKCRHPFDDFRYNPKHYLHGYSYACKKGIIEMRGKHWHLSV